MKWKFSEINMPENHTFDESLKAFYKYGINGLIRENIQNSLDARNEDSIDPVVVNITIGEMDYEDVPGIDEIKDRILSLNGGNDYSKKTINYMQKIVRDDSKPVSYLTMEDNNTRGLSGSKLGYDKENPTAYQAYAYSKGVHYEKEDKSLVSGGSHGIGKIASNAASELFMMFFSNYDDEGYQTLGGNIQLIDHEYLGQAYRSSGYFTDLNGDNYTPYENQNFHEVFDKNTQGLKIIIPFLKSDYKSPGNIIKAVIDGFLLALLKNKLVVNLDGKIISKDTLESYLFNDGYYAYDDYEQLIKKDENFTPIYYQTYLNHYLKKIVVSDRRGDLFFFNVYFQHNEDFLKGSTALFRNMGMKIEDMKITGYVQKPYNAVLIPLSSNEDSYLKLLENQSHTKIDFKHFNDPEELENAKYFINQLHKAMASIIEEELEKLTPSEGELYTNDVLYEINTDFKKHSNQKATKLNGGLGDGPKTVVRTTPTDQPGAVGKKTKSGKKKDKYLNPVIRKLGGDELKTYYIISTSAIRRTTYDQTEIVSIKLGDPEIAKEAKTCHLNITWFDGMGKEHIDQFDLKDYYSHILDVNDGNRYLDFENNRVLDIMIENQTIELEFKKTVLRNNHKLKLYLEV